MKAFHYEYDGGTKGKKETTDVAQVSKCIEE
jgi:hypothetical protein